MNERQERFIDLLRQIFELDKADLDFGIYRILNIRRREIEEFFTTRLPQKITETLQPFATGDKDKIRQRMKEIELTFAGMDIESLPETNHNVAEYKQLKQQLQQGTDLSALESNVYSALYSFFSRYYDEGDFISKRRYKEGVYAIPYEGEEVKLYWANQDQYYIKTSENFKDYTFVADGYNIHFRLVDATTEQNNNKETGDKKRKFMLFTENEEQYPGVHTFDVEGKDVSIRFLYDVPQDTKVNYEETNLAAINAWINSQPDVDLRVALLRIANPDAKADKRKTIIQKHLEAYVAKNSFDYFIHKDLGGFLTRELDFFIKNEVMHLDDLDTESEARVGSYLAKVRAIKRVGKDIITFLAQLENFQKRLWLKKKFVVETNWCITLDRVPEKFYPEIVACEKQRKEWVRLFAIEEIKGNMMTEAYSEPLTIEFLKQNPFLVLDTACFNEDFKNRLVAEIDELDEQSDGLLINSENFQALRLLQEKYNGKIGAVVTDPPYNTGDDDFLYKDNYSDSSWLSMMNDRMALLYLLMKKESWCSFNINDIELFNLSKLAETFDWSSKTNITVKMSHLSGMKMSHIEKKIPKIKESILVMSKGENYRLNPIYEPCSWDEAFERYTSWVDFNNSDNPEDWTKCSLREAALKRGVNISDEIKYDEFKLNNANHIYQRAKNDTFNDYPHDGKFYSAVSPQGLKKYILDAKEVLFASTYLRDIDGQMVPAQPKGDIWTDIGINNAHNEGGVQLPNGKKPVKLFERLIKMLSSKGDIILDPFAGSATIVHAAINTGDRHKYIAIQSDFGYFEEKTKRRSENVVYSSEWKLDKPVSRQGRSQCFKYIRLEQYEDALNNITLKPDANMQSLFGDDYMLQYMLDIETRDSLLNVKAFTTPFDYEMRITEKNETKVRKVDVCETFNYLIGLTVIRQGAIQRYETTEARHPDYEGAVDLVIDREGAYQFRQIEGTLRDGKRVLIIWRNITNDLLASNAALDAYFTKYRINPQNRDYNIIYVNGDSNIENLRTDDEHWKVVRTETEFNKRMFEDC